MDRYLNETNQQSNKLIVMNLKNIIFSLSILMFSLPAVNAQISVKKIIKDTERSINKRVDRGIERGVDDALDNAEDEVRGRNKGKRDKDKGTYDDGDRVEVIKEVLPFNFKGNLTLSIDGSGSIENNLIQVAADDYEMAVRPMLVKKPNNLMIYDKQDEAVTKVNVELYDDKALKEYHEYEVYEERKTKTEYERTSEIKEIESYIARKYIVDGDDYEGTVWLSAEVDLEYDLFASLMEFQRLDLGTMYGFPLEMHISFKNGDTMDYMVKEIEEGDPDKILFDVSDYEVIDMTDLKSGN